MRKYIKRIFPLFLLFLNIAPKYLKRTLVPTAEICWCKPNVTLFAIPRICIVTSFLLLFNLVILNMNYLRLNDNKLIEIIRETLPKNINKTQNILTLKDDTLFTWDFQDNCVLTLNVKCVRNREGDNNVKHQVRMKINIFIKIIIDFRTKSLCKTERNKSKRSCLHVHNLNSVDSSIFTF